MKIGRNDPCPCGSGKKYKKCGCGWKAPVAPADAPPEMSGEEEPELGPEDLDELDPAKADVMSPAYWEKMSKHLKRLPADVREEIAPLFEQMKRTAEWESHSPQIQAAMDKVKPHRAEYEKLVEENDALWGRAENLFGEEPFAGMRFSPADVQRAFEAVGFPPAGAAMKEFAAIVEKAITFLVDAPERRRLAQRLLLTLPGYVAAGRFLDGWIIWHCANIMVDDHQRAGGLFLVCMFLRAHRQWELALDEEQTALFKQLGISPDEIRKMGFDGANAWLRDATSDPEKKAAMERFFSEHPELGKITSQQCRASERAAMEFLEREEAAVLLLDAEELQPWVAAMDESLGALPKDVVSRIENEKPKRKDRKALENAIHGVVVEMATTVFTPARRARLESQLQDLRRAHSAECRKEGLDGILGALMAARSETDADDNPFLVYLCSTSLQRGVAEWRKAKSEA